MFKHCIFSFDQNWSIANTGTEAWPGSCRLIQAGGEPLGATPVYVPPLPPGHSTTVTLKLTAPNKPGTHRGYFHLVTDKGDQIGGKCGGSTKYFLYSVVSCMIAFVLSIVQFSCVFSAVLVYVTLLNSSCVPDLVKESCLVV